MTDSVRPHRRQPTRLPRPWDSPGKNTGVGCHFLLQCMKVKSESEVAQSCPTLSDPMDCSLPGSSVHGIFPGKSTGVGCQIKRLYSTYSYYKIWLYSLCCPLSMGILQARILEWIAISFSRGYSPPRDQPLVFHIAGRLFILWATREAQYILVAYLFI